MYLIIFYEFESSAKHNLKIIILFVSIDRFILILLIY